MAVSWIASDCQPGDFPKITVICRGFGATAAKFFRNLWGFLGVWLNFMLRRTNHAHADVWHCKNVTPRVPSKLRWGSCGCLVV
jgi:hypothetical protein